MMQYSETNGLPEENAIHVVNGNKAYGQNQILNNFCMKVPVGCIYGLLGASGCGKTTLLSCVVGRKKLNSGEICVLGGTPGTPGCGIPGPRVGYMPQEMALIGAFTVKETIYFFGRILNMTDRAIGERFEHLKELLDLPPDNRYVQDCSGGQQRRVSFAVAMVHNPELLILDEPTVGLDPVLRSSLWTYLLKIAEEERTAVLITTHYIEEARNAHKIGLMRQGKLLVEGSPQRILHRFRTDNLEEVFLILSKRQEENELEALEELADENTALEIRGAAASTTTNSIEENRCHQIATGTFSLNSNRMKSLLSKNAKQIIRNPSGLVFTFLFPCLQMLTFLAAIGRDVKNIPLAIVNEESADNCSTYSNLGTATPYGVSDCKFANVSCRFLDEIQDPMFDFVMYKDIDAAFDDVRHGKVVGVMHMAHNFSESFSNRLKDAVSVADEDLAFGEISIWMDMSNRQIGAAIKTRLYKLFQDFLVSLYTDCNYLEKLGKFPLRFQFEYGYEDDMYVNFMVPGIMLTIIHFLGAVVTCTIIVHDRMEGIWDRSIVAGVSSLEIVVAHLATEVVLTFLQTIEVIVITFVICNMENFGSLWLIFALVFEQAICGMCLGFLVSIVSTNHMMANVLLTGMFYPSIYLSGILWPIDAQPDVLRYISLSLPYTVSTISLREVLHKNAWLDDFWVLSGFGVTSLWIVMFIVLSIFAINAKRQ